MRALGFSRFGGPEVLEIVELPVPPVAREEVRIRVRAATVNPSDVGVCAGGAEALLRPFPPPWVPGMELAGTVDAAGPDSGWTVGDRVMAIVVPFRALGGAHAELVVVPSRSVARMPEGASFEQAATLPMNGLTVRRTLDVLGLPPGATVAVTGAAGAVGGYAVELAKVEGLRVIADASPADEILVRALGPDVIVPRGEGAAAAIRGVVNEGVDAVIDAALMGSAILPAIRNEGILALMRPMQVASERGIAVTVIWVREYATNQAGLAELGRLAGAGRLTLRVAGTFPPERAADVHRQLAAGGVRGRLVITW
jgi:NADPH:quinone reductase-like Zn-dependent oxidoreductase